MSAVSEGSHIINKAGTAQRSLEEGVYTYTKETNPNVTEFPLPFGATTPQDEILQWKYQQVKKAKDANMPLPYGDFGLITQGEKEVQALLDKQKAEELLKFETWISDKYNLESPAAKAYLQKIYPDYYKKREESILDHAKAITRIRLIQLRGCKSEDDLLMKYAIDTKLVDLDGTDWAVIGRNGRTGEGFNKDNPKAGYGNGKLYPNYFKRWKSWMLGDRTKANNTTAAALGPPFAATDGTGLVFPGGSFNADFLKSP